ncbi:glycosyl transferase family 1 [Brasilonema octagenarum UFV-E1]|uniref:Glycosyl transferase family 1 n=1 Tax=Brasilonema sennae CENA114 TaxID=415709 RepID=A0A856MK29_9CYAN|nr:glycosyltransferase family 4 protein [Brasilonema sennae]QDL09961.1 glycosyl transferase family 1 [Brasilonema sennae CENA114]QDL16313.1 glycosyl transferase family 1 [Brasilonema octagenarum UFV-E1]
MENISRIRATIRDKTMSDPDILVISRSFQPKEGGIEEYIYNRCLQDPERVIVLTASCSGDKLFDKAQKFPIYRWPISRYWHSSFVESMLQPFLNCVCSFVLAIKLYFRYHYRYIEWGHGYHFLSLLLLSYLLPIRFFIYLHGKDILGFSTNPILRFLFECTLKRAQGIVCNSSYTQDYLRIHFDVATPTHVINPAVRVEKFGVSSYQENLDDLRVKVRNGYSIPEKAVVILSVGRVLKRKGFDRVIENLTLLLTFGMDVHYILCGQGPYESALKHLARRLRVHKRVHFAGYVPDQELSAYYAASDILAMLTQGDDKTPRVGGLGIVCLEAGYFGKPVIASGLGSVVDTVHHEENGILVNPNSGYEVFHAFKRLCQDQKLREQLGRRGKQLVQSKTLHRSIYIPESRYECLST